MVFSCKNFPLVEFLLASQTSTQDALYSGLSSVKSCFEWSYLTNKDEASKGLSSCLFFAKRCFGWKANRHSLCYREAE